MIPQQTYIFDSNFLTDRLAREYSTSGFQAHFTITGYYKNALNLTFDANGLVGKNDFHVNLYSKKGFHEDINRIFNDMKYYFPGFKTITLDFQEIVYRTLWFRIQTLEY